MRSLEGQRACPSVPRGTRWGMRPKRRRKNETARRAGLAAVAAVLAAGIAAVLGGRRTQIADRGRQLTGRLRGAREQPTYTCECGQMYRVTGVDRHRVYWPADAADDQPVLGDACVRCEKPLPLGHDTAVTA